MSFNVAFQYNEDKKQELQQLIDDGAIKFNYDVDCNVFTKSKDEHLEVIDEWLETYGHITTLKKKIQQMYTSTKQRASKKSVGICPDSGSRKFKLIVLVFQLNEDTSDMSYGELEAKLWLKSDDKDIKNKIEANTEELAGLIIARGNNNYMLEN